MLRAFLSRIDRAAARVAVPAAVEQRLTDPNMSADERARAVSIHRGLSAARELWHDARERAPAKLRAPIVAAIAAGGLELEYAEFRDPDRWTEREPVGPLERAVALVAARAGAVRLIDNLRLDGPLG